MAQVSSLGSGDGSDAGVETFTNTSFALVVEELYALVNLEIDSHSSMQVAKKPAGLHYETVSDRRAWN
jgi:hypothetical protein